VHIHGYGQFFSVGQRHAPAAWSFSLTLFEMQMHEHGESQKALLRVEGGETSLVNRGALEIISGLQCDISGENLFLRLRGITVCWLIIDRDGVSIPC
jgi:hypothetical protein